MRFARLGLLAFAAYATIGLSTATAGWVRYGDEDLSNTGFYPGDPKAGATLEGLGAGIVTMANQSYFHSYPFSPSLGEFAGTDQIYVGSVQTGFHDGYSGAPQRINGPQAIALDYSSLVPIGDVISTFTFGIAADDFQRPAFGQPFTATINGVDVPELTTALNALDQTGPYVLFFTLGLNPGILTPNHTLLLSIDQGGDGGDGWAIDFLTVGITTRAAVPEPASVVSIVIGLAAFGLRRRFAKRA